MGCEVIGVIYLFLSLFFHSPGEGEGGQQQGGGQQEAQRDAETGR